MHIILRNHALTNMQEIPVARNIMRFDSVCISTTSRYIHLHDDPRLDPRESNCELSTLQSRGERFSLLPDFKSSTSAMN